MSWEVGTPTDSSGPVYRQSRRRRVLKYLGAVAVGFVGGTAGGRLGVDDEVVTAIDRSNASANASPTETAVVFEVDEPTAETVSVEPVRSQRDHVMLTVRVVNPLEEFRRRGLYATITHDQYESTSDRVVELPPRSRHEYLLRVPRGDAAIDRAVLNAVENDNYAVETRLGDLPERYGDA